MLYYAISFLHSCIMLREYSGIVGITQCSYTIFVVACYTIIALCFIPYYMLMVYMMLHYNTVTQLLYT